MAVLFQSVVWFGLVALWCTGLHNSNEMVRERCMHTGDLYFRHMAAGAIAGPDRTRTARVILLPSGIFVRDVTAQAFFVIESRIMRELFMGMVASNAG